MHGYEGTAIENDWLFRGSARESVRHLTAIMSSAGSEATASEWRLVNGLAEALEESAKSQRVLTDFRRINFAELDEDPSDLRITSSGFGAPRIVVDALVTQAGNISVRWLKHCLRPADLLFRDREFKKEPFSRPMNELLFIKGFDETVRSINPLRMSGKHWRSRFAERFVDAALKAVDELLEGLAWHVNVELDWRIVPLRDGHRSSVRRYEVQSASCVAAKAAEARAAQEKRDAETRLAEQEAWRSRRVAALEVARAVYGVDPAVLLALVDRRENGVTVADAIRSAPERVGVRATSPGTDHRKNVLAIRRALRDLEAVRPAG